MERLYDFTTGGFAFYIHDDYDLLHYCVPNIKKQNKASVQA